MKVYKTFLMMLMLMIVSVSIVGAAGTDNPILRVVLSNYDPVPAEPGQTVDVWVNVQNIGTADANNVNLEFVDSSAFEIISESDRIATVQVIGSQSEFIVKYQLKVLDSAVDGSNDVIIKYSEGSNPAVVSTARLPIDVKSIEAPISVSKIQINPAPVSPGGKTTLSMTIENLARSSSIRKVDVVLSLTPIVGTTVIDLPFVTVNSGNEKSIDRIAPGDSATFSFELATYPSAQAMLYKLPVTINYYDDAGTQYTKELLIGLEVNAKSDLLVNLENAELNTAVQSGSVLFNVINRGTSNVKLMTFSLEPSSDYEIMSPSNEVYLGNIDSDDFQTAKFDVKTTKTDAVTFKVKLTYKDALNNEFVELYDVVYTLREPASTGKSSSFLWIVIVIVVVIVGFVWFKRRKNKNK